MKITCSEYEEQFHCYYKSVSVSVINVYKESAVACVMM